LNELSEYPKLVNRAKKIGYEITKVVFRGHFASPKLQSIHDSSIKAHTELKLAVKINNSFNYCLNFGHFSSPLLFTLNLAFSILVARVRSPKAPK
jgi:hypothetical protein